MKALLPIAGVLVSSFSSTALFADPLPLEKIPLANPSFEENLTAWKALQNKDGVVLDEVAAKSGSFGLRITDESEQPDGNIFVAHDPLPVEPFGQYILTFWARSDKGSGYYGIGGVEILFYDAEGNALSSARPSLPVFNTQGEWIHHLLGATAPPAAYTMIIRITSYTTSMGSIEFDDFDLNKVTAPLSPNP